MSDITMQWLGAAGFRIKWDGGILAIDPFLVSRGDRAYPAQPLKPSDMADVETVFVSHGHFDHIADVPAVMDISGADAYCSDIAADTLERNGAAPDRIHRLAGGETLDMGGYTVRVHPSAHIVFDAGLILRTLPRALKMFSPGLLESISGMPSGPVMIFHFDFDGLQVVHMGSLGLVPEEAGQLGLEEPDILLPPLQGHTHICSRAARLTAAMRPRAVVPQHHDDFFPPISRRVELTPFKAMVESLAPNCRYYEPEFNGEFTATDVFATAG